VGLEGRVALITGVAFLACEEAAVVTGETAGVRGGLAFSQPPSTFPP